MRGLFLSNILRRYTTSNYNKIKRTISPIEAARRLEADFGSGGFVPPLGLAACKRELSRCRDALAPKSPGDAIADGYAEACTLDAWAGYLLYAGANRDETRLVEQKTAQLMEGLRG